MRIGTGWLGWTVDQTLDTPMPMIELAFQGAVERINRSNPFEPPPPPSTPERRAKVRQTIGDFLRSFRRHKVVRRSPLNPSTKTDA